MRLLYVCGTYAPGAFAGSEISAHEMLRELSADPAFEVLVATDWRYTGNRMGRAGYDGVDLHGIDPQRPRPSLQALAATFSPDLILTQLRWSDLAVALGESQGIPTILRVPSKAGNQDVLTPTALIANSRFVCTWIAQRWGRKCHYLFSVVDLRRVVAPCSDGQSAFVTMFNPIRQKGGHILKEVARLLPEKEFAVVPGWHSLRTPEGTWDHDVIRSSLQSLRSLQPSWMPEEVDLTGLPNVRILEPTPRVGQIYAMTRLLLVPSQYPETLARVSIEAFANGIPVIGSKVGGLQEHVGKAGFLIADYSNPRSWAHAIEFFDDREVYEEYSSRARRFIAEEFDNAKVLADFKCLCAKVLICHARGEKL